MARESSKSGPFCLKRNVFRVSPLQFKGFPKIDLEEIRLFRISTSYFVESDSAQSLILSRSFLEIPYFSQALFRNCGFSPHFFPDFEFGPAWGPFFRAVLAAGAGSSLWAWFSIPWWLFFAWPNDARSLQNPHGNASHDSVVGRVPFRVLQMLLFALSL